MNSIAAVMLCGGRSRRMGQDKAELAFQAGGRSWTMASWMAHRWGGHCAPIIWVGPDKLASQLGGSPGEHRLIGDCESYAGQGPVAGLYSGLEALASLKIADWALVLAVDMPDFDPAWLHILRAATGAQRAAVRFSGESAGVLGALVQVEPTRELALTNLEKGERRLKALERELAPQLVPPPETAKHYQLRSSMNTPVDFEEWIERNGFSVSL